jgi:hypothetical protein
MESGGKTITLPPSSDQWALKVKAGTSETIAFSRPRPPARSTSRKASAIRIPTRTH